MKKIIKWFLAKMGLGGNSIKSKLPEPENIRWTPKKEISPEQRSENQHRHFMYYKTYGSGDEY